MGAFTTFDPSPFAGNEVRGAMCALRWAEFPGDFGVSCTTLRDKVRVYGRRLANGEGAIADHPRNAREFVRFQANGTRLGAQVPNPNSQILSPGPRGPVGTERQ